jgi:hypothetical protein
MTNNNTGKADKATRVGQLIAGTKKNFPKVSQQITLDGSSTTIGAALNELQSFIDNRNAVVTAQANAKEAVATEKAATPALNAFINAYIAFIKLQFGPTAAELADFGIPVAKARAPLSAAQKAVAAAKRAATREARGTTSAKAKKAIKGNVTAQVVVTPADASSADASATPATASAAPAQGATPAQPAKG